MWGATEQVRAALRHRGFDSNDDRHCSVRDLARNKRTGDDAAGIGREVNRTGEHDNIDSLAGVATWCDIAGSDHRT